MTKDKLPVYYITILENKNKNIFKPNYSLEYEKNDLFSGLKKLIEGGYMDESKLKGNALKTKYNELFHD